VGRLNVVGWLFTAAVTVVVEACVRAFDLRDTVAAPSESLRALVEGLASGALLGEIGTTLEAFAEGLALAVGVGVAVGVVIGGSRTLYDAATVVIEFLRPIPAVALIPLAIMFLGLGIPMRRFVVAYAAVWPILVNTTYGVRGSDRMLHDVARIAGASGAARLFRVTLPAALPSIATGVRVGASIGLLACVTAEFLTGTGGIGSYMHQQETAFELPKLYAAVILVGALGYGVNLLLRAAQRRYVFWVGEERVGAR
jgi:ABC-type nitrate/sulfonate/bicarbonate transport system permease component